MNFRDWQLYHQIHPLKLATDIGVTPLALYLFWEHHPISGLLIAFLPPVAVSLAMLRWVPNLEPLKQSPLGKYLARYMTPLVQAIRLLTVAPMVYGAWTHDVRFIVLGLAALAGAWCYGIARELFV